MALRFPVPHVIRIPSAAPPRALAAGATAHRAALAALAARAWCRRAGRWLATRATPGIRTFNLEDPTTALHQKYHDGTLQYTMDNMEWVEQRGFSKDDHLSEQQKIDLRHEARRRLCRWPRLLPEDLQRVEHAKGPQRFGPGAAWGDPEEHVFVVSLARRPEKRRRVWRQLEEHQMNATVVNAMDGDGVLYQDDLDAMGVRILPGYNSGFSNHNMPYTTGEVGCFMSHYAVWHRMVEHNIPAALILEDDFDFQANFKARLGEYLSEAQGFDWNLMYVGRSPMENDISMVSEHVVEPGYTLWTVGYILRLDAARALLETQAHQHMIPLDDFFSISMGCGMDGQYNERSLEWSYIQPILRGLAFNPPLVMPYVGSMFKSDTAMLRPGTRYVQDLPKNAAEGEALELDLRCQGLEDVRPMPKAWREALDMIEAIMARAILH
ncbi:unnamed protein product [Durusdinium trenchii]|uniref:Glycosyl transferase family 25 domain-containing protein n=1 Tax=Durusdinium trenchii TaxID=1381693 RepID=A0ABP0MB54_9DINO